MVEAGVTAMVFLSAAGGAGWHRRHAVLEVGGRVDDVEDESNRKAAAFAGEEEVVGGKVDVQLWHRHHGERQAEALLVSDAVETSLGGWRFSLFLPVFYARERKTLPFGFSSIESSHYQDINTSPS
ncbi:hypothetical protein QYE76_056496 [Lolium multiflorum]|uniref:Uncharacterized protein n=1 Tax=Lolium multiflorum TaxID=4521 RepID=A0AAD8T1Q4_LOLMU|nr:hypothetical protein QYE76_056496 [Lolium multiflorum]